MNVKKLNKILLTCFLFVTFFSFVKFLFKVGFFKEGLCFFWDCSLLIMFISFFCWLVGPLAQALIIYWSIDFLFKLGVGMRTLKTSLWVLLLNSIILFPLYVFRFFIYDGDIGKILGIILFLFIEIIGPLLSIISFILFLVSLIKFKKEYFKKKLFFILLAVTQFVLYITYSAIAYFY